MEQWNAINMLVSVMKNDKAIRAIFLKGSWARVMVIKTLMLTCIV